MSSPFFVRLDTPFCPSAKPSICNELKLTKFQFNLVRRLPVPKCVESRSTNPVKVTIHNAGPGKVTFQIEGKIAGPQVAELDRAWQEASVTLGEMKLSLDICGVTYLDDKARRLLAAIFATTQAEFIADTPLTKYFAEQAQQSFRARYGKNLESHSQPKVRKPA
jgi:hypothetical protein